MTYDEKVGKILRSYRTKANICRGSIAYNIIEDQAVSQLNALDKPRIDEGKLAKALEKADRSLDLRDDVMNKYKEIAHTIAQKAEEWIK